MLSNWALGQTITIGNSGSEALLSVHNGIVTVVQQITNNNPNIILHADRGTYQHIEITGGPYQSPTQNISFVASIVKEHLSASQNLVA